MRPTVSGERWPWGWLDYELRDRIAVSEDHEHEYKHVPQTKSVECRGHTVGRMHCECVERLRRRSERTAVEDIEIVD